MDSKIMEIRIRKWIAILQEQTRSGLTKKEWCAINGIEKTSFFRWQRRVRSYLLEHVDDADRLQAPAVNSQKDQACFVELSHSQEAPPAIAASGEHLDGASQEPHPMSVFYGGFSVHISGAIDEAQLTAVLRAMKHAD